MRLLRNPSLVAGFVMVGGVVALAAMGPLLAPHSPSAIIDAPYMPTGPQTLLGSDNLGRDVLSRFLWGGANLVWMAFGATFIALTLGAAVGISAAYFKGWADEVLMRVVDLKMAFPSLVFVLLFVTMLGTSLPLLVLLCGLSLMPGAARVLRGAALAVVDKDFVQWARSVELPAHRILFREILPNITSPLLVETGLRLMWSISLLAGLSYLGYGIQPPTSDWGLMIYENRNALRVQPLAVVCPILAIAVFAIGGNLIAEGFARAFRQTR